VIVLIIGSYGQLGRELSHTCPADIELRAVDADTLDITNSNRVTSYIKQLRPNVVVNAAAYTAVDKAESERDVAIAVNELGAANIAIACSEIGARFIHISTDFVFNGSSPLPYMPTDTPEPLGVYGESKYNGETAVIRETANEALIFRTAWVYSAHGANFVKTMLRLMREKDTLNVIYDQAGSPTWARTLAQLIWRAIKKYPEVKGVYHWTDAGISSWYDFAIAIQSEALKQGLLDKEIPISPIRTSQYPTPAARPAYSVLDCSNTWNDFAISPTHWRLSLHDMLTELKK
jgi:dTDP-4-dehydrorhamnose reductase